MVSIAPEERPLPIPITTPATTACAPVSATASRTRPPAMRLNAGTIENRRPKRSMTKPDTGNNRKSAAVPTATRAPISVPDSSSRSPIRGTTT